jgi:hypothetical protein
MFHPQFFEPFAAPLASAVFIDAKSDAQTYGQ